MEDLTDKVKRYIVKCNDMAVNYLERFCQDVAIHMADKPINIGNLIISVVGNGVAQGSRALYSLVPATLRNYYSRKD